MASFLTSSFFALIFSRRSNNYFDEYSKTPKALKQHEEPENKTLDIDAIADAVMEKIKAKEANQRNLEKEKIKAELLGDLDRYGV